MSTRHAVLRSKTSSQEALAMVDALFDRASDIVLLLSSDLVVKRAGACCPYVSPVGKHFSAFVHYTDAVASTYALTKRDANRLMVQDIHDRHVEWICTPVGDDVLLVGRDVTDLRKLAYFDALTGLPNRYLFADRSTSGLANAARSGKLSAVFFLDTDDFKAVNDAHGHGVGDQILRETATRLLRCVRATDTVTRLGGDEFAIFINGPSDEESISNVQQRIVDALAAPHKVPGVPELHVGHSIGLAIYPRDGDTIDTLLHCADQRMYDNKNRFSNDT